MTSDIRFLCVELSSPLSTLSVLSECRFSAQVREGWLHVRGADPPRWIQRVHFQAAWHLAESRCWGWQPSTWHWGRVQQPCPVLTHEQHYGATREPPQWPGLSIPVPPGLTVRPSARQHGPFWKGFSDLHTKPQLQQTMSDSMQRL